MKQLLRLIACICVFLVCAYFIGYTIHCITYRNVVEYNLYELGDGIYGYYNTVSSSIPAHNYETIVLCMNGNVITFNGDVSIHYTTEEPRAVWTQTKIVNGDDIVVYVPYGSIEMRPNVGLK